MSLSTLTAEFRSDHRFMANVAEWRSLPARDAVTSGFPADLHPDVSQALSARGIDALYSHQAECIERALAGENVVVVTPTASGKTLCYHLPVLHTLLNDPQATALYLYPTKALTQDQLSALRSWSTALPAPLAGPQVIAVYDGDTPSSARARIRSQSRIVLSNPDMLHIGILPAHTQWSSFLANLRYVVIDEIHTYRGVFGSHVSNVLRRLQRICESYGSHPRFLCTSATIANPRELAEEIVEQRFHVVDQNGAPRGEKQIILYNPPLIEATYDIRRSATLECPDLAARMLSHDVQTILFGRTRMTTELLLTYLRDAVDRKRGVQIDTKKAIRGYRGGYLPEERRAVESGLRSGEIRAVTATNALELGIDIGQLQAAILCGYPGSIASLWQQVGRAGRSREQSLAILVATSQPIDQYLMRHPGYLFERSPESALVNPDNLLLLQDQMRCAVAELPFESGEGFGACPWTAEVLDQLVEEGTVQRHGGRSLWAGAGSPARTVSLRSTGNDPVLIQALDGPLGAPLPSFIPVDSAPPSASPSASPSAIPGATLIGQVEQAMAPSLIHDGAVYMHEGATWLVEKLDLERDIAWVRPASVDFYTAVDRDSTLDVLATWDAREATGAQVSLGEVRVISQVTGYRRIRRYTHETLSAYPLNYPPQTLETTAYWFTVSEEAQQALAAAGDWFDQTNEYGPNWEEQRQRVRARDQYKCTVCGRPEPPSRQHDVHHLTPYRAFGYVAGINEAWREANRLDNLILVCRSCHQRLERSVRTRGALDGLGYALLNLAPLHLMCSPSDLGVHVTRADNTRTGSPEASVTLYESIPAGLGFSLRLFEIHETLLEEVHELIAGCPCTNGCPSCVGPVLEGPFQLETKRLTLALLAQLISGAGVGGADRGDRSLSGI